LSPSIPRRRRSGTTHLRHDISDNGIGCLDVHGGGGGSSSCIPATWILHLCRCVGTTWMLAAWIAVVQMPPMITVKRASRWSTHRPLGQRRLGTRGSKPVCQTPCSSYCWRLIHLAFAGGFYMCSCSQVRMIKVSSGIPPKFHLCNTLGMMMWKIIGEMVTATGKRGTRDK
jgi:hypothetical protein